MPCIFCGEKRLSREHIYSRAWIERLTPNATSHTHGRAAGYGTPVPVSKWVSSEADVVVRCVCADCNNGWMNAPDAKAEKMATAMATGELKVNVVDDGLSLLAAWAVKMALVMECLLSPMVVAAGDADALLWRPGAAARRARLDRNDGGVERRDSYDAVSPGRRKGPSPF